jgi:hypothetical protein
MSHRRLAESHTVLKGKDDCFYLLYFLGCFYNWLFVCFFQYCLSGHPTLPCNVLKFKSTTIMLDCGLDMTSTLNFLPLPLVQRYVLMHSAIKWALVPWRMGLISMNITDSVFCLIFLLHPLKTVIWKSFPLDVLVESALLIYWLTPLFQLFWASAKCFCNCSV